jgi:hypothetical protein
MTGSAQKVSSTVKPDDRPKLGRVAVRRIGDGLRDIYDTQAEHVPSRMRELLDQLERTAAESSAAA